MKVICLFLYCMENVGSNMLPFLSSELCNWRSVFFQYYECHRKRSCLPLFSLSCTLLQACKSLGSVGTSGNKGNSLKLFFFF